MILLFSLGEVVSGMSRRPPPPPQHTHTHRGFGELGYLFIFQGAGRNNNYSKRAREQALNFRELGSTVKNAYDLAYGRQSPQTPA